MQFDLANFAQLIVKFIEYLYEAIRNIVNMGQQEETDFNLNGFWTK